MVNTAKVEEGATVAVFGLGGIGLSAIIGAVIAKASRIIAIDINESKFDLARQLVTGRVCAETVSTVTSKSAITQNLQRTAVEYLASTEHTDSSNQ